MIETPDVPHDSAQEIFVPAEGLKDLLVKVFVKLGMFKAEAEMAASRLVEADLRGIHSHGSRAAPRYVAAMQSGEIDPRGQTATVVETPALAVLDGGRNIGHVAGTRGMKLAIKLAKECGTGTVVVRNSHHYGASAVYVLMAAAEGFIGFTTTNTGGATVLGYGSLQPATANNALAWAVPTRQGSSFCLDMACAVSSWGKIDSWKLYGLPMPEGWAVDAAGTPTTDPRAAKSLMPAAGARGYGLALMCSILTGGLAGGKLPLHKTRHPDSEASEHFFYVLDPERFGSRDQFLDEVDSTLAEIRQLPPAPGFTKVSLPGDIEAERTAQWLRTGIPMHTSHVAELAKLADRWKFPYPWVT